MRNNQTSIRRRFLMPALVLVLLLTACGPGTADATPTMGVDAIFTAAFQTLEAQQATQKALTPPTETPSPSPFPSLPPPSPIATVAFASSTPLTGGAATLCDNSAYVSDVTIPDGTTIKPGEKFTKTWRIYNSGSCAWTTSYKLAYDSGEAMGGATTVLAASVPSGQQTDISIVMTAPSTNGTFRGNWRMQNASGVGFGNVIYVEIKVGAASGTAVATSASGMVTISGNAVAVDVLITYTGGTGSSSGTTTSAPGGAFSFSVAKGWSGKITPSKGTWSFTPTMLSYTNVQSDMSGQNFTITEPTATATSGP